MEEQQRELGESGAEPGLGLGLGLENGLSLTVTHSFLSTSNEAVYKVFNETACPYSGQTCKPEVRTSGNSEPVRDGNLCSLRNPWSPRALPGGIPPF